MGWNTLTEGGQKMSELKAFNMPRYAGQFTLHEVYLKSEADKVIADLKADYKEACDRLQTANLIKDEQKAKADKLISCLKYLVMGDLIKDCPPKKVAKEIVKEYDNGLG